MVQIWPRVSVRTPGYSQPEKGPFSTRGRGKRSPCPSPNDGTKRFLWHAERCIVEQNVQPLRWTLATPSATPQLKSCDPRVARTADVTLATTSTRRNVPHWPVRHFRFVFRTRWLKDDDRRKGRSKKTNTRVVRIWKSYVIISWKILTHLLRRERSILDGSSLYWWMVVLRVS